jgi:hypothetical protein
MMARTPQRSPLRPLERGYLYIAERQAGAGPVGRPAWEARRRVAPDHLPLEKEQWRVTADNMEKLAGVFGCEPRDLFRPPAFESVDAIIEGLADDLRQMVIDIAKTAGEKSVPLIFCCVLCDAGLTGGVPPGLLQGMQQPPHDFEAFMLLLDPAWAEAEAQAIVNEVLTHYPAPRLRSRWSPCRLQRARIGAPDRRHLGLAAEAVPTLKAPGPGAAGRGRPGPA